MAFSLLLQLGLLAFVAVGTCSGADVLGLTCQIHTGEEEGEGGASSSSASANATTVSRAEVTVEQATGCCSRFVRAYHKWEQGDYDCEELGGQFAVLNNADSITITRPFGMGAGVYVTMENPVLRQEPDLPYVDVVRMNFREFHAGSGCRERFQNLLDAFIGRESG